ncbi:MAG: DUF4288 domain-containing protein [Bacteroidota bacterium]|jgi:hypothetical protein|nr:MAG: DUF4288 domain-containing protein [Bacteroidota bacterium]
MTKLPEGMNWYLAKLVYQIVTGEGRHMPQFDIQYRLIRAEDTSWALEKAQILGKMGETSFSNVKNELVRWKFLAVEDISRIASLDDGEQVYGQIVEPGDPGEYVAMTRAKARRILEARAIGE